MLPAVLLAVVGPDAELFDEHADKPATSAAAVMPAAATDLARAFLIAFGSFVVGGPAPPSLVGHESFGNVAAADGSEPRKSASVCRSAPNTGYAIRRNQTDDAVQPHDMVCGRDRQCCAEFGTQDGATAPARAASDTKADTLSRHGQFGAHRQRPRRVAAPCR
jgi:hypothetical protein